MGRRAVESPERDVLETKRPIQEQFGDRVIKAFADFARADLPTVSELERVEFSHVSDVELRRALAQALYGVRWIYKRGLALLTKDEERAAHIRAQIVDYASVCEGLLSYCIAYAITKGYSQGEAFRWTDPDRRTHALIWHPATMNKQLSRSSLWWLIRVAREFHIIDATLADDLDWLRRQRNAVHLRQRVALGQKAFLGQSRKAFQVVARTVRQSRVWKNTHP